MWHLAICVSVTKMDASLATSYSDALNWSSSDISCIDGQKEEPEEEDKLVEDNAMFLHTLKGTEAVRRHMCQFHIKDNLTAMCNEMNINYTE
jgi:hypothetical protein